MRANAINSALARVWECREPRQLRGLLRAVAVVIGLGLVLLGGSPTVYATGELPAAAPAAQSPFTAPEIPLAAGLGSGLFAQDAAPPRALDAMPGLQIPPETPSVTPAPQVTQPAAPQPAAASPAAPMSTEIFLDRLMLAESGGRLDARNPRSTALGPYQFIESTFLEVVRRHFTADIAGLVDAQILTLRTDLQWSRRAAHAFSQDNAAALLAEGVPVTFPNLRLAFLLGPAAAIRVLQAPPATSAGSLVGSGVVLANPFMAGLTAGDLAARAARDLALPASRFVARPRFVPPPRIAGSAGLGAPPLPSSPIARTPAKSVATPRTSPPARRAPAIVVLCNRDLPSCRRWIALQTQVAVARTHAARGLAGRRGLTASRR